MTEGTERTGGTTVILVDDEQTYAPAITTFTKFGMQVRTPSVRSPRAASQASSGLVTCPSWKLVSRRLAKRPGPAVTAMPSSSARSTSAVASALSRAGHHEGRSGKALLCRCFFNSLRGRVHVVLRY